MPSSTANSSAPPIRGLLDEGLLGGQTVVSTILRPPRPARLVDVGAVSDLRDEIARACEVWGGAGQPLVPMSSGKILGPYRVLLQVEQVDGVFWGTDTALELPDRVRRVSFLPHPIIAIAAHRPKNDWQALQVVELDADDPWRDIYASVLGILPEHLDSNLHEMAGLNSDVRFEDVVRVERVNVTGSLGDLLERLTTRGTWSPREFSTAFLGHGSMPDSGFLGHEVDILPNPCATKRAAGPNIVVAVAEGSVEDLALLWNLRGAHGQGRAMPIGIPVEQLDKGVLNELEQPGHATLFGFAGGICHITSVTVPLEQLEGLASASPRTVVARYEDLLTFGPAPGRHRSHIAMWKNGETHIESMSDDDRKVIQVGRQPQLTLDVTVEGRPLPSDATMRGREHSLRFQAGAAQVSVSELNGRRTSRIVWPSSWTCLAAAAETRGLKVSESEPGVAAATLIRSLGSITQIRFLKHQPLITLIYRMAEPSGMTWWKNRWAKTHKALLSDGQDPEQVARTAQLMGVDKSVIAPPGEGRAVPFEEFVKALGGNERAAQHWVAWAERRHILVRGAAIKCQDCLASFWLPFPAVVPPVACSGCGREIIQPFGPKELRFTYRLGEPLRRVLETDSLGHVLALQWLVSLFELRGLVGAHPGVNFIDRTTPAAMLGEADVLLLFADGNMVPIEVKRSVSGADDRTLKLMDNLAAAIHAPWDALVVTRPAREVRGLSELQQQPPLRPRKVLTDDQLHMRWARWTLNSDPFAWAPRTKTDDAQRESEFERTLAAGDPDIAIDQTAQTLLGKSGTVAE